MRGEMVLILSEEDDSSTCDVMHWLNHFKKPYYRLNGSSAVTLISLYLQPDKTEFTLRATSNSKPEEYRVLHSSDISAYWYRRGHLNLHIEKLKPVKEDDATDKKLKQGINNYLQCEARKTVEMLYTCFEKEYRSLGAFADNELNKLEVCRLALKLGLNIPGTLVCGNKNSFLSFRARVGSCMAKASDRAGFRIGDEFGIGSTNKLLKEEYLTSIPQNFGLTLFQQYIRKRYDIRSFFLDGSFYSVAILSQSNEQTRADFRNYDPERPNRIVPYTLPDDVSIKLLKLMRKLGLKTGSLDLLKDDEGTIYFLEVNPVGQYGFISERCNYHLDKRIADYLCHEPNY
jgi:ATP-GRASP peptide maturase of grasp-with-spasm system